IPRGADETYRANSSSGAIIVPWRRPEIEKLKEASREQAPESVSRRARRGNDAPGPPGCCEAAGKGLGWSEEARSGRGRRALWFLAGAWVGLGKQGVPEI